MKTRWLVLSLALVAVAAVAAVVFSSQGSEVSNGLSKGILPAHGVFWNRDYGRVGKDGQLSHSKGRPFYGLLCVGPGIDGRLSLSKKVPAWIPSLLLGAAFAATDEFHQSFTGRTAMVEDVVLDSCGVAAGCLVSSFLWRRGKKKRA